MFEDMTAAQIKSLIRDAQAAYENAMSVEETIQGERKARIQNSIEQLTTLIGQEDTEPSLESIRGVQAFDDATIQANSVLAVRMILEGMEQLALITRDLAETLA